MKNFKRKILIMIIVIFSLYISSVNVIADPVVNEITTVPANPTPQSAITIIAGISGEDITSVNVTVSECKVGLCFIYNTYPMNKNDAGDWEAHATLQDDSGDSTYIKYEFNVTYSGQKKTLSNETWKVNLSIENSNNTPSDNNGKTPGFEIITLLAAIIIGTVLLRKKRY